MRMCTIASCVYSNYLFVMDGLFSPGMLIDAIMFFLGLKVLFFPYITSLSTFSLPTISSYSTISFPTLFIVYS